MLNYNFILYEKFRDVLFYDETHSYYYKTLKLTSATQIKDTVKPKFDTEYWLVYCTLKNNGFKPRPIDKVKGLIGVGDKIQHYTKYKVNVDKLRLQWKQDSEIGLSEGSYVHEYLENAWRRKYIRNRIKWLDQYVLDHKELTPIELELIVSDLIKYAGQIDGLFYNSKFDWIEIHDYKTDKEIEFENKYDKLKPPFSHLDACNWNEYCIQVNIYRELISHVLNIAKMYIIHFDKKEKIYTKYKVDYLDVKPLLYDAT